MKILLDTNIVLDILLKRDGFYEDSVQIFALIARKKYEGFLCPTTLTTIYYILRKNFKEKICTEYIGEILKIFEISKIDKKTLIKSLENSGNDFEDSVIYTSANESNVDIIITRDKKGFKKSIKKIMSPKEFLAYM